MTGKAFVYTELQVSVPFTPEIWQGANPVLLRQPGLQNKTWLSGIGAQTTGGLYEFDSIENARRFVVEYFPARARARGVAQTTRVFDGSVVEEASRYLNSMHFDGTLGSKPGAFVYTEAQISAPFDQAPWRAMNPILKAQPGLLHKTWLSGVQTNSVGGFTLSIRSKTRPASSPTTFPTETAALNIAYTNASVRCERG